MKKIILLLTCFLWTLTSAAQSDLIRLDKPSGPVSAVKTSYDRFKDLTFANVSLEVELERRLFDRVELLVGFSFAGEKRLGAARQYILTFVVEADNWRFLEQHSRNLIFLADGDRISIPGEAFHNGKTISRLGSRPGTREYLSYSISANDLKRIVNAASSEFQLGMIETRIDADQKAIIVQILKAGGN